MLELYSRSNPPKGCPIIADAEEAFMLMRITRVELAKVLLNEIDQARYIETFGAGRRRSSLGGSR